MNQSAQPHGAHSVEGAKPRSLLQICQTVAAFLSLFLLVAGGVLGGVSGVFKFCWDMQGKMATYDSHERRIQVIEQSSTTAMNSAAQVSELAQSIRAITTRVVAAEAKLDAMDRRTSTVFTKDDKKELQSIRASLESAKTELADLFLSDRKQAEQITAVKEAVADLAK